MIDPAINSNRGMRKGTMSNSADGNTWSRYGALVRASAIALILSVCSTASYGIDYAFNFYDYVIPADAPSGTVLTRQSMSIASICKTGDCSVSNYKAFNYNGSATTGYVQSIEPGIAVVFTIDGRRYTPGEMGDKAVKVIGTIGLELISTGTRIPANASIPSALQGGWSRTPIKFTVNGVDTGLLPYGNFKVVNGTCKVRSQTVILNQVMTKKFGEIGSTQGSQPFDIHIDDCPAGFNAVNYAISPAGGVLTGPGILPLGASSTATGVQILITDPSGTPQIFGKSSQLSTYNKKTGGSYQIQMNAAYIKTGASVTPGTVNGSMIVLIDYQ
ncbi:type 1 fimbrial protein [Burkholderia multivorans]|uniref:fimbrial protein n=1 Tax=Burkholderia multivorans TaxID=87883 RepID=UPI001C2226E9|nr:fimbrial protein [Burkholderia multivorans]MBU9678204.1 type 1 fimbrial protein [Burkholderia multivorans]